LPAAAALGLIGSFFLPNAVAEITDARRLDNLVVVPAQSVSVDADPELSLPERIALVASPNKEALTLTTGHAMTTETAEAGAIQEIAKFFRNGPFEFTADECAAENGVTSFIVDSEDPSINIIVWEFKLLDRHMNEATVTIDDETGVILKLIYRQGNTPDDLADSTGEGPDGLFFEEMYDAALRLTKMMAEYYGLRVALGDYQLGDNLAYYKADIAGGGIVAPMYGVVRTTGFTMNESV
jgi:hypothetical protein